MVIYYTKKIKCEKRGIDTLEDETLTARLYKYRKEHEYAKEIEFNDTIRTIKKLYDIL